MENTEGNMGMPGNAMWGNMNWGNTPPYWGWGGNRGAGGIATGGLITGIIGCAAALLTGGFGLYGMNRNGQYGPNGQGPQNDRIAALEAQLAEAREQIAVNTATDISNKELTAALLENAKQAAEIKTLESERRLDRRIDELQTAVVTNAGTIGCVQNNLNKLITIGIPSANVITPPTAAVSTSTAGA